MRKTFSIHTKGFTDVIDITSDIQKILDESKVLQNFSLVHIFVIGSTVALTTIEHDPNLYKDLQESLEKIIPYDLNYRHHKTWGDNNGASHIRASLIGQSLMIPIDANNQLELGTWQHIVLIDFDTKSRTRKIVLTFL